MTSDTNFKVGEVFVCDERLADEDRQAYELATERFDNHNGAMGAGWLEPTCLNPERLFGHLLGQGFESQTDLAHALSEFSKVEGCNWANDMLQGFNWR